MATVSTTATFAPSIELWEVPMRPDNTPIDQGAPIGKVSWLSSVVVPALTSPDVSELAVTLTTISNYALRFINLDWTVLITNAGCQDDVNDIEDQALLTVPNLTLPNMALPIVKPAVANAYTITNKFSNTLFRPGGLDIPAGSWQMPFRPTTAMVFRVANESTNTSAAAAYQSNVSALMYTIEQFNQGHIYRTSAVTL